MKHIITQQANGLFSIYTDTGAESMADEKLIDWDLEIEQAEAKVNWLNKIEEFKEKYNNFKLGDKFPYYNKHNIVECEAIFNLRTFFKTKN